MRQFLHASDAAFGDLERWAKSAAYINFRSAELPPGCVPPRARIGLRVNAKSGATTFFIERGGRYYGASRSIGQWVQHGEISFAGFKEFRHWIRSEVGPQFGQREPADQPSQAAKHTVEASLAASRHMGPSATKPPSGAAASEQPDPVESKLLGFLVRHIAVNYGIEVESIEAPVFRQLHSKLLAAVDQATCDTVVDDALGGAFALASVEGHRRINLQAGPPITCSPERGGNHA